MTQLGRILLTFESPSDRRAPFLKNVGPGTRELALERLRIDARCRTGQPMPRKRKRGYRKVRAEVDQWQQLGVDFSVDLEAAAPKQLKIPRAQRPRVAVAVLKKALRNQDWSSVRKVILLLESLEEAQ